MKHHFKELGAAASLALGYFVYVVVLGVVAASVASTPVLGAGETDKIVGVTPGAECWVDLRQTLAQLPAGVGEIKVPDYPDSVKLEGWPRLTANGSALFVMMENSGSPWVVFYDKVQDYLYLAVGGEYGEPLVWEEKYLRFGLVCPNYQRDLYLQFDKESVRWGVYWRPVLFTD